MKNKLLIIISMVFILGCSKDEPNNNGYVVSLDINISYINSDGNDLLNSSTINYYQFDSIKHFNVVNGAIVEVFIPNQDCPRNLMYITETNPFLLRVFTNTDGIEVNSDEIKIGESTSYLQLSSIDTDTITTEWRRTNKSTTISKVWYNGVLVENYQLPIEIIKY